MRAADAARFRPHLLGFRQLGLGLRRHRKPCAAVTGGSGEGRLGSAGWLEWTEALAVSEWATSRRAGLAGLVLLTASFGTEAAMADSEDVQRAYDTYADSYDQLDGGGAAEAFGMPDMRRQILALAKGDVLEAGVGTGINLQYYNPQQVSSYTGIDLSESMLQQARRKAAQAGLPQATSFQQADVQSLPFEDGAFDTVVDTFSLCVYPDPAQALAEMRRVVRPDGAVLLLAHSKSNIGPLAMYQDVTADSVTAMGKGCAWNQDLDALLADAGLRIESRQRRLAGLLSIIVARRLDG